jgi:hypothetical protein
MMAARKLAIPAGFEPATHGVESRSSNLGKHQSFKALSGGRAVVRGLFRDY